jgi:hypothetical protein
MPIDYAEADRIFELSFEKLNRPAAKMGFPKMGSLSEIITKMLKASTPTAAILPHQHVSMLATASIEMWHRAIHSFLWSVALTEDSPLWSSVSGYYASHYVMRAFAHSLGIYKSFVQRSALQIVVQGNHFVCSQLSESGGEHAFYWKAVKGHSRFRSDPLFHENQERDVNRRADESDVLHRNFANYADHLDSFTAARFTSKEKVAEEVRKIGRIRRHSVLVSAPQRDSFPDVANVQILAFQRIVAFNDFLDDEVPNNRFWKAHRRPSWCKDVMLFQVEDQGPEQPMSS